MLLLLLLLLPPPPPPLLLLLLAADDAVWLTPYLLRFCFSLQILLLSAPKKRNNKCVARLIRVFV